MLVKALSVMGTKAPLAMTLILRVSSMPTSSISKGIQPRVGICAKARNNGLTFSTRSDGLMAIPRPRPSTALIAKPNTTAAADGRVVKKLEVFGSILVAGAATTDTDIPWNWRFYRRSQTP
ncbi:hypothetical protein [Ochrobactrum teleogrylli]